MRTCGECEYFPACNSINYEYADNLACGNFKSKQENKMSTNNIDAKIEQNAKDIERLQEEQQKLKEEKEKQNGLKVGDIVKFCSCGNPRRVVLFSEKYGRLVVFNERGRITDHNEINRYYVKTGQNIFTNNLLNLDS